MKSYVTDFGVFPSETILQTKRMQAAIDDCFLKGGGVVSVPAGTYLIGGIRLRSNVTLYLESGATLLGSRNPEDYFEYLDDKIEPLMDADITKWPKCGTKEARTKYVEQGIVEDYYADYYQKTGRRWNNALIRAIRAENIAIVGEPGSVIDGDDCYDAMGEEGFRGPHGITMHDCENVLFRGYTMKNSSNWGHNIVRSKNVHCEDLAIYGGHDGVHFTECQNVTVLNSEFYTGDDCIAGFANINMLVSNCKVNSSCNGFRIGGTNVMIQDCHIWGPGKYGHRYSLTEEEKIAGKRTNETAGSGPRRNMVSAVTYYADNSFPIKERPGNIIIKDCVIEHTDRFLHYNYSGSEKWQLNRPLGDITFQDIRAKDIKIPINIYGDKDDTVTATFRNIDISESDSFTAEALIHACNYKRITLDNVTLQNVPCSMLVKRWSVDGEINLHNIQSELEEDAYIGDAKEAFFSARV